MKYSVIIQRPDSFIKGVAECDITHLYLMVYENNTYILKPHHDHYAWFMLYTARVFDWVQTYSWMFDDFQEALVQMKKKPDLTIYGFDDLREAAKFLKERNIGPKGESNV